MNNPKLGESLGFTNPEYEDLKAHANSIVVYQGGGYDGCFWEYNMFYISKEMEVFNIQSTGHSGVRDLKDVYRVIDEADIYHLDNKEEMANFSAKESCRVVYTTAHFINVFSQKQDPEEPYFDIEDLEAVCEICGKTIRVVDSIPSDYRSAGGIVYTATKIPCEDCQANAESDDHYEEEGEEGEEYV